MSLRTRVLLGCLVVAAVVFATRASGGSGLGLSIVAAIAVAHGGRVSVDTAPGAGARFVVDLPLVHAERIRTSVASGT